MDELTECTCEKVQCWHECPSFLRMETRTECEAAGVEYIEKPVSAEELAELRKGSERLAEIENAVLKLSKAEGRNHAKRAINELYDLIGI